MHIDLELERDKDRITMKCLEARVFRVALDVLEDRNNHIGGK
jgi:hypothetical protein